ncbi:MAG: hypothetical protein HDQ92_04810 [Desulfovibrio sp.]|nr:hypothetical protein [Desulfovibrio sp.]
MDDLSRKIKRNPKRRVLPEYVWRREARQYDALANEVKYVGSSKHKRNPGNFHLDPPATKGENAMTCDVDGGLTEPRVAQDLLQRAFRMGMVDERIQKGKWPCHVWGVWQGIVFEGKWSGNDKYHGYPLEKDDPLRERILEEWEHRDAPQ